MNSNEREIQIACEVSLITRAPEMDECKERDNDGSEWQKIPPFLCEKALQAAVQKDLETRGLYRLENVPATGKVCTISCDRSCYIYLHTSPSSLRDYHHVPVLAVVVSVLVFLSVPHSLNCCWSRQMGVARGCGYLVCL